MKKGVKSNKRNAYLSVVISEAHSSVDIGDWTMFLSLICRIKSIEYPFFLLALSLSMDFVQRFVCYFLSFFPYHSLHCLQFKFVCFLFSVKCKSAVYSLQWFWSVSFWVVRLNWASGKMIKMKITHFYAMCCILYEVYCASFLITE